MKYLLYLLGVTYIIGAAAFVKIFFFTDNAQNPIVEIKKNIVLIIPEQKSESFQNNPGGVLNKEIGYGIGAGFFLSADGKIQTVNHLVENPNIKYRAIYKDQEYDLEIIKRDKENDLAIGKINSKKEDFVFYEVGKDLKVENGDKVYSFGIDTDNKKVIYNIGEIINKKSKLDGKSNLLEISNNLSPGFSGGPIFNKSGNIIGINYATSNGKNYGISLLK